VVFALAASQAVVNPVVAFIHPGEVERSKGHIPGPAGPRAPADCFSSGLDVAGPGDHLESDSRRGMRRRSYRRTSVIALVAPTRLVVSATTKKP